MNSNINMLQAENALNAGRAHAAVKRSADPQQMRETAQEFEAVFLGQMLQPLFKEINAAEPFGGGPGEEMWRQMQVDEFGKAIAKNGGVGIADMVMAEMLKLQEVE